MSLRLPRFTRFQLLVHVGALLPLAVLIWDAFNQNLTVNPIQAVTFRTGKTALILLLLCLACTPANTLLGFRPAIAARRPLGLYAFLYASLHFLIFIGLDYGFDLHLIWLELAEKRYVLVGFAAFLILLPLALTSTRGWQRRLKKRWKSLHKWVYVAGVLVVVHYIWVVKSDIREPLIYGGILALLLLARVPAVRKFLVRLRTRSASSRRRVQPARTPPQRPLLERGEGDT